MEVRTGTNLDTTLEDAGGRRSVVDSGSHGEKQVTTVDEEAYPPASVQATDQVGEAQREIKEEEGTLLDPTDGENVKDTDVEPAAAPSSNMIDLDTMKDAVFFLFEDRNRRLSGYWLLLILASVIATFGIAGDSPATVIGAMIVAPLMTPILGTVLSIVLTDGRNFIMSICLVVSGVLVAIFIGYLGALTIDDAYLTSDNNSQVAARVNPRLTDLFGALATGAVGSIALVRKDISGSLPGVSIAISLVPPLCVVGISLGTGSGNDAIGALLLFGTNLASILVVGVIVMYIYGVQKMAKRERARFRVTGILILALNLIVISVPLILTSIRLEKIHSVEECTYDALQSWGLDAGWKTQVVVARQRSGPKFEASIIVAGPLPGPETGDAPNLRDLCDLDKFELSFLPTLTVPSPVQIVPIMEDDEL